MNLFKKLNFTRLFSSGSSEPEKGKKNVENDNNLKVNDNDTKNIENISEEEKKESNKNEMIVKNYDPNDIESDNDSDDMLGGPFDSLEEEIAYLRSQNYKLKKKVEFHKSRRKLQVSNNDLVRLKINGKWCTAQRPPILTLDELSTKVQERLPEFLKRANKNKGNGDGDSIYIPSENKNEIGILDIQSLDLWDMIEMERINTNNEMMKFQNDQNLEIDKDDNLGGGYIVLKESDIVDAIACFVSQCVIKIPECRNLSHEEMIKMIDATFAELRSQGIFGKMRSWGSFVYSTYGWTASAYKVYSNAAMVRTLLSCMISAAWVIGFL